MPIASILWIMSERLKIKSLSSPWLSIVGHVMPVVTVLTCQILSISSFNVLVFHKIYLRCILRMSATQVDMGALVELFLGWSVCIEVHNCSSSMEGHGKSPFYDMRLRGRLDVGSSWTFMP